MPQRTVRADNKGLQASIIIRAHQGGRDKDWAWWLAQGGPGAPGAIGCDLPDVPECVVKTCSENLQTSIIIDCDSRTAFKRQPGGRTAQGGPIVPGAVGR